MSRQALGIIETAGLAAAIEAADAAVKSAQVELIGYELSRGGGMAVVKVTGNVSSVNAAIDAARIAASRVNKICGYKVIARMAEGLDMLVYTKETVGYKDIVEPENFEDKDENIEEMVKAVEAEVILDENDEKEPEEKNDEEKSDEENNLKKKSKEELCNLCWDPACPRRKGDLRIKCIHYNDKKRRTNK